MNNSLIGVVLCGGASSRMGADKGLIRQQDRTWVETAVQKLEQIVPEVYVSINSNQLPDYQQLFPSNKLIIDSVDCKGPLAGLLSSHLSKSGSNIFLLACDMVKMDVPTLRIIVDAYGSRNAEYDFYVFIRDGEYEPLAGIYTSKGIQRVFLQFQERSLKKHSMKYVLENGNTLSLNISDTDKLTNYNSPADLSQ